MVLHMSSMYSKEQTTHRPVPRTRRPPIQDGLSFFGRARVPEGTRCCHRRVPRISKNSRGRLVTCMGQPMASNYANNCPLPHVVGMPDVQKDGSLDLSTWLPPMDCPMDPLLIWVSLTRTGVSYQRQTPRSSNRCEPGNLVAMELASGLPVIMSANTGHLDLIEDGNSFVLHRQTPVAPYAPYTGVEGWGEPDVEEVIAHLTKIYEDQKAAATRGIAAANTMKRFTWGRQVSRLLDHVDRVIV